ncbi:MAG: 3-hydroxyacyl-CoA dehydrogenase family protein, partial [Promethearchaeota archaeon]
NKMEIKNILVVGAGTMGHSIAQVYATGGFEVNLVDLNKDILDRSLNSIKSNLNTLAEFGCVKSNEIPDIINRIHPSTDLKDAAKDVDLAVEAVNEIPDVKNKVFSQLSDFCSENTILASNTSSLNIFKIVKVIKPERLVIQHWYAPPHIIPLVEIVPGRKTSKEVIELSVKLIEKIGRKPVVLNKFIDQFIVNKIQNAIGGVVFELLMKKITDPETIDAAIKYSLGIRLPIVGVVQTFDFTGLDLVADILKSRGMELLLINDKIEQGNLGAKTGKGFYDYGSLSEIEILKKRDRKYLKVLELLEEIKAFDPI